MADPVHMAVVSNESRRPIRNVICIYGHYFANSVGRLVDQQPGTSDEPSGLFDTMPLPIPTGVVIHGGQTYGFVFKGSPGGWEPNVGNGEVRFTDDADLYWQLDEDLHLKRVP